MRRDLFESEHDMFRDSFRRFLDKEIVPRAEEFERDGIMDRAIFAKAGEAGFLGMEVPEEYGGGGVKDFRYNTVISEEIAETCVGGSGLGITLHNDICLPYFLHLSNEEQKQRWLPGICSGELITAVAMTEPGIGSDLASMSTTAVRDGGARGSGGVPHDYIVNGSKTFITNGINADLVITAVKTDPTQKHKGVSLMIIERGMEGFDRGRNLEKIGLHSQDTAELFFTDVRVPAENLLGAEGEGFRYLVTNLPQERLSIAVAGVSIARAAYHWTLEYVKERKAFGQRIADFQNTRFKLAEMATDIAVAEAFVDKCILAHNQGQLSADEAAMAKYWCTELQGRITDLGVQLHGGYGFMTEYPIARAYVDARVTRIYGGTTEIMKEIIGKSILN